MCASIWGAYCSLGLKKLEERIVFECEEIRSADILGVAKSKLLSGTKIKPISTMTEGIG